MAIRDSDGKWIQPSKLVDNDGNQIGTSGSPLIVTGSLGDVTLSVSDIEIGAVELKNSNTDDRVKIDASGFLYTSGSKETDISASLSNIYNELKPTTDTTYTYSVYNSITFESCSIVKSSPGTLYGISGYNSNASDQYILVFDSTTEPTAGSVPKFPIKVTASSNFTWDAGRFGIPMTSGITISNSTTAGTLTSGSNDVWVVATYK